MWLCDAGIVAVLLPILRIFQYFYDKREVDGLPVMFIKWV